MPRLISTSLITGIAAALALLGVYFAALTLVSGWNFAAGQFAQFWYFIVTLALGFGVQIGLYAYLKGSLHHGDTSGKMVAVTGTTSTAAMVSCCAHYLVNILPILGATGIATIAAQYQVKLFWVGIAFNLLGIAFIGRRIMNVKTIAS
ncbi:MAG: hypothetical protein Q7S84_02875 [bacterium]|nr:hypothetical protein [bacterium]